MTRAYLMAGSGTVAPRRPARSLAVGLGGQSAGAGGLPCSRTGDGPPPAALGSSAGFRGATLFRCGLAPPLQLSLAWSPRDLATVFRHRDRALGTAGSLVVSATLLRRPTLCFIVVVVPIGAAS